MTQSSSGCLGCLAILLIIFVGLPVLAFVFKAAFAVAIVGAVLAFLGI